MIALPGVAIQSKIYESSNSLVYRGIREEDGLAHCADTARVVIKILKQDYPSIQELIRNPDGKVTLFYISLHQ
jgi:hypothetical protein